MYTSEIHLLESGAATKYPPTDLHPELTAAQIAKDNRGLLDAEHQIALEKQDARRSLAKMRGVTKELGDAAGANAKEAAAQLERDVAEQEQEQKSPETKSPESATQELSPSPEIEAPESATQEMSPSPEIGRDDAGENRKTPDDFVD